MPTTPAENALSLEQLRALDLHAALDRSQDARRTLAAADAELRLAVAAFETGLDDHVSSGRLRLLDSDVESATAAQASASWRHAESEVAVVGAAGWSPDAQHEPRAPAHHATFAAGPRAATEVAELLRRRLTGVVDPDLLDDVEVLAGAVTRYSVQLEDPVRIAVELDVRTSSRHQVTVTVTVSGSGAHGADSPASPTAPSTTAGDGGRGLEVLDSLARVWGTQRRHRRTSVWFSVTAAVASRRLDREAVQHVERAAAVLAEAAAVTAGAEARLLAEFEAAARRAATDAQAAVTTAAAVVADAVLAAARRARGLDSTATQTDAHRAAQAAALVRQVAETAADGAAQDVAAGAARLRDAATARRTVYDPGFLRAVPVARRTPPTG